MTDLPIAISSVTPYHDGPLDGPLDEAAWPPRSVAAWSFGWLLLAALAVAASFAHVYSLILIDTEPADSGILSSTVRYTIDGWGRVRIVDSSSAVPVVGTSSGPHYGVLLCLAAAVMLLGCLQQLPALRLGRLPAGRAIGGVGSVFLLGVVASEVVATMPRQRVPSSDEVFRFGLGPWLAAGVAVLGLALWFAQQRLANRPVLTDQANPDQPEPFTEQEFSDWQAPRVD